MGSNTTETNQDASLASELRIAGLVPFSTVDWPGKLAAAAFLQGCPWKCPYCHNSSILDPKMPGQVPWSDVLDLLQKRGGLLDGVVFSGGEALMQGGTSGGGNPLESAIREVRDLGFKVGLHTAGIYPKRLEHLLELRLIDWVGLDIKAMPEDYQFATGSPIAAKRAEESFLVLAGHPEVDWEVRLTLWPPLVSAKPDSPQPGESVIRASSEVLIDYARRVAKWSFERGARQFALQRFRVPPTPSQSAPKNTAPQLTDAGSLWAEDQALAAITPIGFSKVTVR